MSVVPFGKTPKLAAPLGVKPGENWAAAKVKCLACSHEWIGAFKLPANDLECPECKCMRGAAKGPYTGRDDDIVYVCKCDNTLMELYVAPGGVHSLLCTGCGTFHQPWNHKGT